MSLSVYHYTEDVTSPSAYGKLWRTSNLRILWEIPGGVQAVEFDYSLSPSKAYDFYNRYLGTRIIVADHVCDRPVAEAWIYGIAISPVGCRVLCKGPWFRHFDEFDDTAYSLNQSSSTVIKTSLTNFVPILSSDQTHIEETSFTLNATGTWDLSTYGLYPGDLITKLASMSNSNLNQWNYWVKSAPFVGTDPQAPVAYFEEQVNDGTYAWEVLRADLAQDGFTQERNIEDLSNNVLVLYRDIVDNEQALTSWSADTTSQDDFWLREIVLSGGEMVPDGATYYRDLMLAKYKDPQLKRSFTVAAPYLRDSAGHHKPLWYPIKDGGGYLRIRDLYADAAAFDASWDRKRVGQIMTAEYDDAQYSLRVSLDTTDNRVDALLAQLGLL